MGFARDVAKVGTFGLAGLALSKKKRDPAVAVPQTTSMISPVTPRTSRVSSMIGSSKGGY